MGIRVIIPVSHSEQHRFINEIYIVQEIASKEMKKKRSISKDLQLERPPK